ncbi:MAG: DedA family protein [bacterium]|nr:DedA family protein [bacterium]
MEIFDFILHIDGYLANVIGLFGPWTYVILFAIIFAETGLVITPFLPGDSLLFAAGALAGGGFLNIWAVYLVMLAAAILGDSINYWIGHQLGPRVFSGENPRFFKKAYLEKTREFYEKHGGKTIILARFMPIIRTFAPFVAGVGKMRYSAFLLYNIVGAFVWVTSLALAGYFFGGLPLVKANFEYVVIGIIVLSLVPMGIEYLKYRRGPRLAKKKPDSAAHEDIQATFKDEHLND